MEQFDIINDNEIRIVGDNPTSGGGGTKPKRRLWKGIFALLVVALLLLSAIFLFLRTGRQSDHRQGDSKQNYLGVDTLQDAPSYVVISDTVINDLSLRSFIPVDAKPKLVVGLLNQIPQQYVLGAMAADFGMYGGEYQVVGSFVEHGKMLSHSKSKYGFCAILKDSVVIGNDLSTPFFEQAIEENGDFFRQYALVQDGKPLKNPPTHKNALRRALCRLDDGRLCVIDTDMEVSLNDFAIALCDFGVYDAISLMGTGAAVRWAVDHAGRRYIAGADEYEFPNVVNYIVWE